MPPINGLGKMNGDVFCKYFVPTGLALRIN